MPSFVLLVPILLLQVVTCEELMGFSSMCDKCTQRPCSLNVGLLANLSSYEEAAINEVVSVLNKESEFDTHWKIKM